MTFRTYLIAFLMAAIVTAGATAVVLLLARAKGVMDTPDRRRTHGQPVPSMGGIGIYIGFVTPIAALMMWDNDISRAVFGSKNLLTAVLGGGSAMLLLGIADDVRGLRARHKLLGQVIVAVAVFYLGIRISTVDLPWIGMIELGWFALPITVLWIVGVTNAINLIDGLDGLAAGVVFFVAVMGAICGIYGESRAGALLVTALAGSSLGFLIWNYNPARIFMGDTGSLFLGSTIAMLSIENSHKGSTTVALLVPVVALGVPITDVTLTVLRRFLEQRPLFAPDRGHIHHRLMDRGMSHRRSVLVLHGATVILVISAMAIYIGRNWTLGLAVAVPMVVLALMIRTTGIHRYLPSRARDATVVYSGRAEDLHWALVSSADTFARAPDEASLGKVFDDLAQTVGPERLRFTLDSVDAPLTFQWPPDGDEGEDDPLRRLEPYDCVIRQAATERCPAGFAVHWRDSAQAMPQQGRVLLRMLGQVLTRRILELRRPISSRQSSP